MCFPAGQTEVDAVATEHMHPQSRPDPLTRDPRVPKIGDPLHRCRMMMRSAALSLCLAMSSKMPSRSARAAFETRSLLGSMAQVLIPHQTE